MKHQLTKHKLEKEILDQTWPDVETEKDRCRDRERDIYKNRETKIDRE